MSVLRLLLTAAVVTYSAVEALAAARAVWTARRSSWDTPPGLVPLPRTEITVLVPGLNETEYCERTVEVWRRELARTATAASVVFVASARDTDSPTTAQVLAQLIGDHPRMRVLVDPRPSGNKASQLNWAVEVLEASRPTAAAAGDNHRAQVYGVFDFDSQPEPGLLDAAASEFAPDVDAVQAPVVNLSMLREPRGRLRRALLSVDATHHLVRSLGTERARLRSSRRPALYFVGAGLFVRSSALHAAGGFPFVDDITLGYRMSAYGGRIATTSVVNRVDGAGSFRAAAGSMVFVSRGVVSWVEVALEGLREGRSLRRTMRLSWLGLHETFELSLYPWLALVLSAEAVARRRWMVSAALLPFWLLPFAVTLVLPSTGFVRRWSELAPAPLGLRLLVSPARRFWRTFGIARYLTRAVRARITGGSVRFTKSDRAAG